MVCGARALVGSDASTTRTRCSWLSCRRYVHTYILHTYQPQPSCSSMFNFPPGWQRSRGSTPPSTSTCRDSLSTRRTRFGPNRSRSFTVYLLRILCSLSTEQERGVRISFPSSLLLVPLTQFGLGITLGRLFPSSSCLVSRSASASLCAGMAWLIDLFGGVSFALFFFVSSASFLFCSAVDPCKACSLVPTTPPLSFPSSLPTSRASVACHSHCHWQRKTQLFFPPGLPSFQSFPVAFACQFRFFFLGRGEGWFFFLVPP